MKLQERLRTLMPQQVTSGELDNAADRMDELEALLAEADYALGYAADMTKPEGMMGCDCPICTVSRKISEALR